MDLNNKAALVTGAASGIGEAAVRRLAAAGTVVAIVDRDESAARALAMEVGGLALPGDVTDADRMMWVTEIAEDAFGHLDIVLLNAGAMSTQSGLENLNLDAYRRLIGVNVDHVVLGTCAAVPALRRAGGGTIVVTSSLAGLIPASGDPLYTLSKHAVVGYVRAAAAQLAEEDIRICAVCPGYTDTALIEPFRDQLGEFPLLSADDVAAAVVAVLERGTGGECWFVQPGREPGPYEFRNVPGPAGGVQPPELRGPELSRQDG